MLKHQPFRKNQADQLYQLVQRIKAKTAAELAGTPTPAPTRVLVVTSGKGGVGKTSLTVNLALALQSLGRRVIILDADLGLANIDITLGIMPKYNLYHVIKGELKITDVLCEGPWGIKIIAGGSGIQELADLHDWQIDNFIKNLNQLEGTADVMLIDTGAGISSKVLSFVLAAEEVLLITTPEPTAMADAYGMIKVIYSRQVRPNIKIILNRITNTFEGQLAAEKLKAVVWRFLDSELEVIGYIPDDPLLVESVKRQTPLLIGHPKSTAAMTIRDIAARLAGSGEFKKTSGHEGLKGFFQRVINLFHS